MSQKNKKRILFDSDLDNSLVIEHNRTRKIVCRKETPLKISKGNTLDTKADNSTTSDDEANMSINNTDSDEDADSDATDNYDATENTSLSRRSNNFRAVTEEERVSTDEHLLDVTEDKTIKATDDLVNRNKIIERDESSDEEPLLSVKRKDGKARNVLIDSDDESALRSIKKVNSRRVITSDDSADDDDGPDEDEMVMSRATRMSIMGMIPKVNDSDESDFIESDEVSLL